MTYRAVWNGAVLAGSDDVVPGCVLARRARGTGRRRRPGARGRTAPLVQPVNSGPTITRRRS